MPQSFDIVNGQFSADVANAGTFTATVPSGRTFGDYYPSRSHRLRVGNVIYNYPAGFTLSYSGATITITNGSGVTFTSGQTWSLELHKIGDVGNMNRPVAAFGGLTPSLRTAFSPLVQVELGAPATAVSNGVSASQSVSSGVAALLNGSLLAGGLMVFDVPRNAVGAWTGTAIVTIVGTDEYGVTMTEASASGTSHTGKKAFKTITSITPNASITGATFGTGVVLGLPVFLPNVALIVKEIQDAAVATAGTSVVGIATVASTTTGDVRGTYNPNSAPNGAITYQLLLALADPGYRGTPQ